MEKIAEVLDHDRKLVKLLLAQNEISDSEPLLELLSNNGRYLSYVDLSNCIFSQTLPQLGDVVTQMPALEDLALCSIFNTQDPPAL